VIVAPREALSMAERGLLYSLQKFCQPTPRLIRKGEKSDTFTELAGIPYEGRT